mgnify:CR=1 FL=1
MVAAVPTSDFTVMPHWDIGAELVTWSDAVYSILGIDPAVEPLSVERGFAPGTSTVTLFGGESVLRLSLRNPTDSRFDTVVELPVETAVQEHLQLRTEYEYVVKPTVVQRLLAYPVTREREKAILPVPNSEREHSNRLRQRRIQSPERDRLNKCFGIRMPPPLSLMTATIKL